MEPRTPCPPSGWMGVSRTSLNGVWMTPMGVITMGSSGMLCRL